ncbi:hypothetical protein PIB30_085245 [Stylosanthes scabra]|uniref:Uncharacterized protein n=1 Tax=Stylosanthes scabra TaxID=79078 RepID=A0ABU6ZRE2_9FABA|nr:hypothetical protein [Stylosanthes scabra]
MCDPGASESVMSFELYELLDLGPLKKSKEVFTMVDTSIVTVADIAENVLVKIGKLTIPADFHVRRTTKGDKGGNRPIFDDRFCTINEGLLGIEKGIGRHQKQKDQKRKPRSEKQGAVRSHGPLVQPHVSLGAFWDAFCQ